MTNSQLFINKPINKRVIGYWWSSQRNTLAIEIRWHPSRYSNISVRIAAASELIVESVIFRKRYTIRTETSIMVHFLRQYALLMWRQWIEVKRNVLWTIIEVGLPGFFAVLLLAIVRINALVEDYDRTTWLSFRISDRLPLGLKPQQCNGSKPRLFTLTYVPNNTVMYQVMESVTDRLSLDVNGTGNLNN